MAITIDTDVAMPPSMEEKFSETADAVVGLKNGNVGDSFLVPPGVTKARVWQIADYAGVAIAIYDTESGVRVWRTA